VSVGDGLELKNPISEVVDGNSDAEKYSAR
jgi:hypothetical protein